MENVWWNKVPNARILIDDVVSNLSSENSVLIAGDIPWRDLFLQEVKDAIRLHNSTKGFEGINGVENPGEYLLEEYCKSAKRASYRPSKSHAKFFAESDDIVIHENYFWVNVTSETELKAWTEFVAEYCKERPNSKSKGTFILECKADIPDKKKGIKRISVEKYINEYDLNVFATLMVSELDEPTFLKEYLVELATNTLGDNIELLASTMLEYNNFVADPYDTVLMISEQSLNSEGNKMSFLKEESLVEQDIWKAQIRTIYPYIEEYRRGFVEKYASDIQLCLPIEVNTGERVYEANEVELGTLVYLAGIRKLSLPTREYEKLERYKTARNNLSHLNILSWDEIVELFQG